MNRLLLPALVVVIIFLVALYLFRDKPINPDTSTTPTRTPRNLTYPNSPAITIDLNKNYRAVLKTTAGDIEIEFFTKDAPVTVNNFLFLAKNGFYNDTFFHRIIQDFMIQGGDPKGDGTGGPGYKFADETITRNYDRGIVAMANSGPDTNGSQFFIVQKDTSSLVKNYVIFGKVAKGLEVVDKIAESAVGPNAFGEISQPNNPTYINSIEIVTD